MQFEQNFANEKDSIDKIHDFIEQHCIDCSIDSAKTVKINICADEIISNIVHYSKAHLISVKVTRGDNAMVVISFTDDGIPFNPLKETKEVDTSLPPEERGIGGLGVFLVKKMMKEISYRRENNTNIFTIAI